MKDERLYLVHIAECIERIEQYTTDGKDAFLADRKTQDAVIRNFEIGEAAKRISEATRRLAPRIPWPRIAGFRDVLIHQYVAPLEVWEMVEQALPDLKTAINTLLAGASSR